MINWRNKTGVIALIGLLIVGFGMSAPGQDGAKSGSSWKMIGGTSGNSHYSALSQINRTNVARLLMA